MKSRSLALVLGLLAALAVPAQAAHPNIMCVDVGTNERYGASNDDMIEYVRAIIGTNDADHEEPSQEGCVPIEGDFGGTNIDFEITGAADPDASGTPETPDMTCTIAAGGNNCYIEPPPSGGGTQTIRAWIDRDGNNTTVEADTSEGYDQDATPGDQPEPDATDVMNWIWTHGDPGPGPCGPDHECSQRITIRYRAWRGTFSGRVDRENAGCAPSRVTVWRVRPGTDRKVATTRADEDDWRVHTGRRPRGRYYAVLARTWIDVPNSEPPWRNPCLRARSRTIEIG